MAKKVKPKKKAVFCDPAVCDCCQYIGNGDFVCDKYFLIVVSDWKPTAAFLMCKRRKNNGK